MRCLLILAVSASVFLACAPLGIVVLLAACVIEARRTHHRPTRYRWENDQ